MKAYTQGEIDYFCGVYAIINGCRWMLKEDKRYFSFDEGCVFYQHMIEFLLDQGKFIEVLHHGTDYELLNRLLNYAKDYIKGKFDKTLRIEWPYKDSTAPIEQVTDEIGLFLTKPYRSCIVRLHNIKLGDHWSLATAKTSGNRFKLFDSYGASSVSLKNAVWAPHVETFNRTDENPTGVPRPPRNKTYIAKEGLVLLSLE